MPPFPEQRATTLLFLLRGAAERLGCSPIGSHVGGPEVANLPQTRLYGRYETSFRFLKFAFNLLSAAHCQIPRLLGRDIDRKSRPDRLDCPRHLAGAQN